MGNSKTQKKKLFCEIIFMLCVQIWCMKSAAPTLFLRPKKKLMTEVNCTTTTRQMEAATSGQQRHCPILGGTHEWTCPSIHLVVWLSVSLSASLHEWSKKQRKSRQRQMTTAWRVWCFGVRCVLATAPDGFCYIGGSRRHVGEPTTTTTRPKRKCIWGAELATCAVCVWDTLQAELSL